jgi:hypothetical protein
MGKRKYRTVAAAVLAGAVLFSPLLCGMSCLEAGGVRPGVTTEMVAPAAGEFLGEVVESGVVGCLLAQVVLRVDVNEFGDLARVGSWVWVGVEAAELAGEIGRRGDELVGTVRL